MRGTFFESFHEPVIILITKPEKTDIRKEIPQTAQVQKSSAEH